MVKLSVLVSVWCLLSLNPAWAADPTAPPQYQANGNSQAKQQARLPSLQATFVGDRPAAILNQQRVERGEQIAGYQLYKVTQDFVVLQYASKHYKIYLDKVSVKQTVR